VQKKLSRGLFLGRILKRRKLAGLTLTETGYEPEARIPKHSHENGYLSLVRQGEYTEICDKRRRSCGPMTLAFHPPGEIHSQEFHDSTRSFNLELEPTWLRRVQEHPGVLTGPWHCQGGPLAGIFLKLYEEFHHTDEMSPLAIEGLALELIAEFSRRAKPKASPKKPSWVARAWDIVQTRFTEPLSLEEIAAEVGVHPVYLSTVFRQTYRSSLVDVIRRRRVEFAAERLASTDLPLATVAHEAGFADHSYFSNVFKKQMGLTPSAFRRAAQ
jgi:AraC family transcriptional regulator